MPTKKVLASQAISALQEQATRFSGMSVLLAKSATLATTQSNDITEWANKLINAVTRIREGVQHGALERQEQLKDEICKITTLATSRKRKALDSGDLEVRTLKANFRLVFGPPKEKPYSSMSTKYAQAAKLSRVTTLRALAASHPDGIVALCVSHPTKDWTEAGTGVFDSIVQSIKDEVEQAWPDDIVDIMGDLEKERPMIAEFSSLRATLSQRKTMQIHIPRSSSHAGDESLLGSTVHPQMPSNRSHQHPTPDGLVQRCSLNLVPAASLPPSMEMREMKYMYTNSAASNIALIPEPYRTVIQNSRQWKWERSRGLDTTGCWANVFPKDVAQDFSFTIWGGHDDGYMLNEFLGMQLVISSS